MHEVQIRHHNINKPLKAADSQQCRPLSQTAAPQPPQATGINKCGVSLSFFVHHHLLLIFCPAFNCV